ncbi:MAG: SDR family oxidoreductase [Planctomycetota bacterium]
MTNSSSRVLITGASTGIGADLARLFAQDHYSLILVSRNQNRLETLAQELQKKYEIVVDVISVDLAQPNGVFQLWKEIEDRQFLVEILVNNAGIGVYGEFINTALTEEIQMIQLNVVTLTALSKFCLKKMKEQGKGKILNVASTAAFQPGPMMAVYYASKAYVLFFSEALSCELEKSGITVTTLCPGPTKTEFMKQAKMEEMNILKTGKVEKLFMTSEAVARIGYRGLMKGKRVVITGTKNYLAAQMIKFAPKILVMRFLKKMLQEDSQSSNKSSGQM